MKRALLIISLLVNVLLITVYVQNHQKARPVAADPIVEAPSKPAVSIPPAPLVSQEVMTNDPVAPVIRNWADIKDTNWFQYKSNLVALGCPAPVIKDVLEAELDKYYFEKQRALMDPFQNQYWDIVSKTNEAPNRAQSEALNAERRDLFAKLVTQPAPASTSRNLGAYDQVASEDSKTKLREIDKEYEGKFGDLDTKIAAARVNKPTPEQRAEMTALTTSRAALNAEKDRKFRDALTPEERKEYELRTSSFVQRMGSLQDFTATPEELKKMAQMSVDAKAQAAAYFDALQEGSKPKDKNAFLQTQNASAFEASMQANFGQERLDQYKLASDPDYQNFSQWSSAAQLPAGTARQLYDEKKTALATAAQIRKSSISPDEKEAALREVRAAVQSQVQTHIKGDDYSAFQKANKSWLNSLE